MCTDCGEAVGWHCIGIWEEAAVATVGEQQPRVSIGSDPTVGGGGGGGRAKERSAAASDPDQ